MSAPAKRLNARLTALPAPELVSLRDAPGEAENVVQAPWWEEYDGTRDARSGVIAFPAGALPPCSVPGCRRCADRKGA